MRKFLQQNRVFLIVSLTITVLALFKVREAHAQEVHLECKIEYSKVAHDSQVYPLKTYKTLFSFNEQAKTLAINPGTDSKRVAKAGKWAKPNNEGITILEIKNDLIVLISSFTESGYVSETTINRITGAIWSTTFNAYNVAEYVYSGKCTSRRNAF